MDLSLFLNGAIVFMLGGAIGSFLNVVIYRLPAGLSVLHPPSRCPHCMTPLRKRDNLPIIGWLKLRGKCAHCQAPISSRYPIVEAVTGLLFLASYLAFGLSLQTPSYWLFLSLLLALALIDFDTMTLSNPLMKTGVISGLLFQAAIGFSLHGLTGAIISLASSAIGMVLGILLIDAITVIGSFVFRRPAMGDGDAFLAAMMGAWLGWKYLLLAIFLAALVGAIVGMGGRLFGQMQKFQKMPFGPCLALGAALSVFIGHGLLSSYLALFAVG
ncbi:prepilin peptidase [filamentous cyanobacterium LEGE 11480]|uniref:Prepilin leader peptidase/N-methyltransferase n=1 Tax=Romeriopsis navalis LEGE 11480 TaxID=2777977 RepID=A0A928VNB7_9CYAN|nr:A24 family peptidase [Romeriopsis navalis]MBE9029129.1 prepilin peptidase [Romeriopsis navalis LEGE 11480]